MQHQAKTPLRKRRLTDSSPVERKSRPRMVEPPKPRSRKRPLDIWTPEDSSSPVQYKYARMDVSSDDDEDAPSIPPLNHERIDQKGDVCIEYRGQNLVVSSASLQQKLSDGSALCSYFDDLKLGEDAQKCSSCSQVKLAIPALPDDPHGTMLPIFLHILHDPYAMRLGARDEEELARLYGLAIYFNHQRMINEITTEFLNRTRIASLGTPRDTKVAVVRVLCDLIERIATASPSLLYAHLIRLVCTSSVLEPLGHHRRALAYDSHNFSLAARIADMPATTRDHFLRALLTTERHAKPEDTRTFHETIVHEAVARQQMAEAKLAMASDTKKAVAVVPASDVVDERFQSKPQWKEEVASYIG